MDLKDMDKLLIKYIKGEVTPEERDEVIRWMDESPDNLHQYSSLRKLYDLSLWNPSNLLEEKKEVHTINDKNKYGIKHIFREVLKAVAILVIGFIGAKTYLNYQSDEKKMQTVIVPTGQRVELLLADGTKVWLNSRSKFRFPERFGKGARRVELDGEGYFDVAHNEKAPFTVQTKQYDVKVLGTEFNVKAYSNSNYFETALLKGRIEVQNKRKTKTVKIEPNELLSCKGENMIRDVVDSESYFRWREGLFCFDDETIGSLIEKMELYYDTDIEVQKTSLMKYRYSGKFRIKDGIEHVLKVLQLNHKFDYVMIEDSNEIIIK